MNVATRVQPPGWKSMPAQLKAGGSGAARLLHSSDPIRGVSGLGMTAQEIADLIKTGTQATLPLIVAQTPGVIYTQQPDGSIQVYSQPTGTTANLPGVYGSSLLQGGASVYPSSSINANVGGAAVSANLNLQQMAPYLIAGGVLLVLLMAGKK